MKFTVPALPWRSPKTGKKRLVVDCKYTEGRDPNWTRKLRYQSWKMHVQKCAAEAGVKLPLRPTKLLPLYIVTIAYFQSGVHADCSNVWEGVTDALCYVSPQEQKLLHIKKGSDKYTGGLFFAPRYDKGHPRVEVIVFAGEQEFLNHVATLRWVQR